MIKYTEKLGEQSVTIECETMDELIQYLKSDKSEVVNVEEVTFTANENVDKALVELVFNKSFADRFSDRMAEINNAPNYID